MAIGVIEQLGRAEAGLFRHKSSRMEHYRINCSGKQLATFARSRRKLPLAIALIVPNRGGSSSFARRETVEPVVQEMIQQHDLCFVSNPSEWID
jgi:hypothetical protein